MRTRVFISRDSGALCVGAEEVARTLFKAAEKRGLDVEIVRTGSRGMYWLEPTIEVARPEGRIGYGPVKPSDIDSLLDAGMLEGGKHPLSLRLVEHADHMIVIEQRSRGAMAKPKAIDGLERDAGVRSGLAELHAELLFGERCQSIATCGLAGLGAAKLEHAPAWRLVAEVVIEGHCAVDLGAGQVERLCHHGDGGLRHAAKDVLQRM